MILWFVLVPSFLPRDSVAFPVKSLTVNSSIFGQLSGTGSGRDSLATRTLLPELQKIFKQAENSIEVEQGDIVLQSSFPDQQIDGDCHHKIEAEHPKAKITVKQSSFLRYGVADITWHGATVFADGEVDAKLDINTDVCVRVGRKIFGHHCSQLARKTVGIDVVSDGRTGIGINMTASHAHVARVNGTWSLVFHFHASVVGMVLKWNVEKVSADNCKIKILDITIGSVCGMIQRHVKSGAQKLTDHVTKVTAPKLLSKLQAKINTAIGSEVVVPLTIWDTVAGSDSAIVV